MSAKVMSAKKVRTDSKLNVAIKIKRFLILGGNSDSIKCNRFFDYAVCEFVKIANRLKVMANENIDLSINEDETILTASKGSQVFTITKV